MTLCDGEGRGLVNAYVCMGKKKIPTELGWSLLSVIGQWG